ncbi:putative nuclease HARBI1 [Mercenaria mercenaria]|uniref:putative nuclease HARBI1 n=1 Tax=Mercenaria mercenaria TaxID=6596 RepID=UPI00234E78C4|nr:putative nuclease HARBI1 [Mercenaria mercenaria]
MARRQFHERPDFINTLTNAELVDRYRLDRDGILYLHESLKDILDPATNRNNSVSSLHQILITLRYYATGGIQLNDADIHGISQPTVSRCISKVTDALCSPAFIRRHISFPVDQEEVRKVNAGFFGVAGFPHVIDVIDGTHIQIKAPVVEEASYVNRMGYHSINTQVVFDDTDRITDVVARWPGSTHDSRILRESALSTILEGGHVPGPHNYLLGDSGYPCKKWLLTPYLNPPAGSQTEYNKAHKRTRAKVERAIGQFKRRWGILHGEVRLTPEKACRVIMACAVLHNICRDRNIPFENGVPNLNNAPNNVYQGAQNGLQYRNIIAATYF